jgi:hypothetical protein
MSFNFNELNLTDNEISTGAVILKPGKYVVKIKDTKVEPSKSGGMIMKVKLEDVNGGGSLNHWINLLVKTSAEATRIGRSELKTMLFYGGHPNPDRPGDVNLINGLTVGVVIKEEKYTKNGMEKNGSAVAAFIDPAEVDPQRYTPKAAPVKKASTMDDEIPF